MIPKEPYLSWQIKEKEYPKKGSIEEQARFLVRYGLLAPSSHNMQPWKFIVKSNTIRILPDFHRSLPYSDRMHRELYISLGCALANIEVAAHHFGFALSNSYLSEEDIENSAVTIILKLQKAKIIEDLFPYIMKRRTNRFPYEKKEIKKEVINEIIKRSEKEVKISIITDENLRHKIVVLIKKTSKKVFSDKLFKEELSHWVTSIYTKRHDGIALFDFGIPGFLTKFASVLIRNVPGSLQAMKDEKNFQSAPAFLILSAPKNNKESWIRIGKEYEYLNLICTRYGIATAPWAGLVENEIASDELAKLIGLKDRPLFFARIGYVDKYPHHSPRRLLEEVSG